MDGIERDSLGVRSCLHDSTSDRRMALRGLLAASVGAVEIERKNMGYRNAREKCIVTRSWVLECP